MQRDPDAGLPGGAPPAPASSTATASSGTPAASQAAVRGPELRQGPLGDIVVSLPDWPFLPADHLEKSWRAAAEKQTLMLIPVPELGVVLDLRGMADAGAAFHLDYRGRMHNIQAGLSYGQAAILAAGALSGHLPSALAGLAAFGSFRGLADIEMTGSAGVRLQLGAALEVAARTLGLELGHLGAGFDATASLTAPVRYSDRVGLYYADRQLKFRSAGRLDLGFHLTFDLRAFVEAALLGFRWRKPFTLASFDTGRDWRIGAQVDLSSSGPQGPPTRIKIDESALDVLTWVRQLLSAATDPQQLTAAPGGPAPSATGPAAAAPTGRSQQDPIPMYWYKSPGKYPTSIQLGAGRYFLTEPDWLPVPDRPGLADVRRDASTDADGQLVIKIGVSPGGKYYPKLHRIWPRVQSGVVRTGTKQDQFRRLLSAHDYAWGGNEADHVRDLQWRGEDAYENLWPLDSGANNAANEILDQPVTYRSPSGVVGPVPLRSTPLNLYFEIIGYR